MANKKSSRLLLIFALLLLFGCIFLNLQVKADIYYCGDFECCGPASCESDETPKEHAPCIFKCYDDGEVSDWLVCDTK